MSSIVWRAFRLARWLVVGASGVLLTSDDDGKTWTRTQLAKIYPFSWLDLFSIRFAPDRVNGWISGEQGLILRTTDAGKSWQKQQSGVTDNIYRVAPVDAQNAVAAGVGGALLYYARWWAKLATGKTEERLCLLRHRCTGRFQRLGGWRIRDDPALRRWRKDVDGPEWRQTGEFPSTGVLYGSFSRQHRMVGSPVRGRRFW